MTLCGCKKGGRIAAAKPPQSFPQLSSLEQSVISTAAKRREKSFATDATRWHFVYRLCAVSPRHFGRFDDHNRNLGMTLRATNDKIGQEQDNQEISPFGRNDSVRL